MFSMETIDCADCFAWYDRFTKLKKEFDDLNAFHHNWKSYSEQRDRIAEENNLEQLREIEKLKEELKRLKANRSVRANQ